MKTTLISLDKELFSISIRILSSCLKKAGHDAKTAFLVPPDSVKTANKFLTGYSEQLLDRLAVLCSDSGLIGISLMSNQFLQAIRLTEGLKVRGISVPFIWGGIQPTVEPEECLEYADIICMGEGEEAIVELADALQMGREYTSIRNLCFKTTGGILKNELRPLISDLDAVPFPDYSCQGHYIAVGDDLQLLTREKLAGYEGERFKSRNGKIMYMFMTSRGCPFNCSYCGNNVYRRLYPKEIPVRWRSPENVIEELRMIQRDVAPISYVYMVDDNFTARSREKLRAFCELYKKKIGIPFFVQVNPLTINEEKMEILFNNGCAHITMGVETASERIADMYYRGNAHGTVEKAIALVEKYRHLQIPPPTYQFIIDNPWETLDEMLNTLRLACSFPRPWSNPIYSLMLFPGVPLYYKALEEGIIHNKTEQIYTKNWRSQSRPFLQLWIKMYHANFHPFILHFMLLKWIARFFTLKPVEAIFKTRLLRRFWEEYV